MSDTVPQCNHSKVASTLHGLTAGTHVSPSLRRALHDAGSVPVRSLSDSSLQHSYVQLVVAVGSTLGTRLAEKQFTGSLAPTSNPGWSERSKTQAGSPSRDCHAHLCDVAVRQVTSDASSAEWWTAGPAAMIAAAMHTFVALFASTLKR